MFRFSAISSLIVLLLATGCKDGPSRKPRSQKQATAIAPRSGASNISRNSDVAERTRAVTRKRQGAWSLTSDKVRDVSRLVAENAGTYDLSEDLIYGIIWVESRFNPRAVSPVGAKGLMQLMPMTARYLADCIDWSGRRSAFNPEFNIAAGSYYIARLIKEFNGDEDMALAAYNAGPAKVRRWMREGGLPKVSIEYATMVQTARTFFRDHASPPADPRRSPGIQPGSPRSAPEITDEDLDRLGLTILIAGLSNKRFGTDREDSADPFDTRTVD